MSITGSDTVISVATLESQNPLPVHESKNMRIQNCFVLFTVVFILNACTVPTSPITNTKTPEQPIPAPVTPVPTAPDTTPANLDQIVLSDETVATGLPCTLESQAPALIAQPTIPSVFWQGPQTITRKQRGGSENVPWSEKHVLRDPNGNTLVLARANETSTGQTPRFFYSGYVVKFDISGNRMWSREIASTVAGEPWSITPEDMVADQTGNTYMTFELLVHSPEPWYNSKRKLIKLDPNGNLIWERSLPQGFTQQLQVDARGQLWVLNSNVLNGYAVPVVGRPSWSLRRFDPDGQCRLEAAVDTTATPAAQYDQVGAIAADDAGSIYLTGTRTPPTPSTTTPLAAVDLSITGPFITKLDWRGKPVWTHFLNASRNDDSELWSWIPLIRVVGKDMFVATSDTTKYLKPRLYLKKFNLDGKLIWARDIGLIISPLYAERKRIRDLIVLGNGDLMVHTNYDGFYSNCCHPAPESENHLLHLDSNGNQLGHRWLSRFYVNVGFFASAWIAGPGNLVTTIDTSASATQIIIKQFDLIANWK